MAVEVRILGRVQGVWYRDTTRREAERLGVRGWVRNCPDGSVEAHFEGGADAVDALLSACREGPPGARVESLDATPVAPVGHAGFRIVRTRPEAPLS